MKNYFVIHGSFGDNKEHWIPWLQQQIENKGYDCYAITFPIGKDIQTYDSWSRELDRYKDKINSDTIFVARSIGAIFVVKYILLNNLKIKKLISISGFNCFIDVPDYDYVNKTFFLKKIKGFEKRCSQRICIFSDNDPYVPYYLLDMFPYNIKAKRLFIAGGGHFNCESGYKKFELLLKLI